MQPRIGLRISTRLNVKLSGVTKIAWEKYKAEGKVMVILVKCGDVTTDLQRGEEILITDYEVKDAA